MKKSSSKVFEAKSPKVLIPIGLAAAGVLAYFTAGSDTTKQASIPISVIEVAQPEAKPGLIPMSEIGKIVLANGRYNETIFACITKTANGENFLIDRVVLNAPIKIDSEFGTSMVDRSTRKITDTDIVSTPVLRVWGVGNNAANTISQQMTLDPKSMNFVTFYGSWNGSHSTEGDVGTLKPILVPSKQLPSC